ncbi:MAG: hypothetical protein GY839_14340 [candidate division Zixibacteria bacterium]|nr:hypothetical protein [candidate division Zixibacteria bacterium]
MTKKLKNESGIILLVCLSILFMLSLIGIASITTSNNDMQIAENESRSTGAFYAAESGLEQAAASINHSYGTTGNPPSPLPSGAFSELNYTYKYATTDDGAAVNTQMTEGAYKGLYGLVKTFTINSFGADVSSNSGVELQMQLSDALIPIFQFAVFYEDDLEIAPGPDMTLGGRVHSNKDMYIQAGSNLYIDSYLTAAGSIYHGRKPGSGRSTSSNDVYILDEDGNYQSMKNADNTFLDANDNDWVNESLGRWDGLVEDGNHGITQLDMPVVVDGPATNLIDRGDGNPDSYEHKAGLKFTDGQAYYLSGGTWLNVTGNLIADGIITTSTFHDGREGQDVKSIDLDMDRLNSSPYFPDNGIIYSTLPENGSYVSALRLVNATELANPLTVVTDNPLYTLGDYNTVNKKPAAVITDALTILSNDWDDLNSWSGRNDRVAANTQVNVCFMTGNTETGSPGHDYSGGFENLPRFLEKWSGKTLKWRGSAVDLWYSRQNTGAWGGSYYKPPTRDWAFDPDLLDIANLPPGTPQVHVVQRMNWSQKIASVANYESDYGDEEGNGNDNGNGR